MTDKEEEKNLSIEDRVKNMESHLGRLKKYIPLDWLIKEKGYKKIEDQVIK